MNNRFKAFVASVLAVMMIFTLAACGGSGDGGNAQGEGGTKPGSQSIGDYAYVSSFMEFDNGKEGEVTSLLFTDKGFYTTGSDVIGQREPEEGEEQYYEGQFDITAETLSFMAYDGVKTKLEGYKPFEYIAEEGHDSYAELQCLAADKNGELAGLYHIWENWVDAPDGVEEGDETYWDYYESVEKWFIRIMSADGAEKSVAEYGRSSDEWFYPYSMVFEDGKLLIASNVGIIYLNTDGSTAENIKVNGYVDSLVILGDGRKCVTFSDSVSYTRKLGAIDFATGKIAQTWDIPNNAYSFIPGKGDGEYDLYYSSGVNVYGYDLETGTEAKLFDWLNEDVVPSSLSATAVREDGSFFAITNSRNSNWEYEGTEFVTVVKKPIDEVPVKETLTLACIYPDDILNRKIVSFNRSSSVRIEVVDYSQYNTDEDWNAGTTKLTTEIMAGNLPDILALNGMPYKQLAAKGLLADLYPFIDADSEMSRDDFMPNVLAALEVDGKLCTTATGFTVQTLTGSPSIVGDKPGWTFDDLRAALAKMPEGCTVLDQFTTCGDILRICVALDMDNYVDWTTGKCSFDSKEFVDLLEFTKLFPNTFDWESYDWEEYQGDSERIAAGKQMLKTASLYDFSDIVYNETDFGGKMTYIGYPCSSGVGSFLSIQSGYAISEKCADKETAWNFLRTYMNPKSVEANENYYWGFPVVRKLLESKLKDAMTIEYEKDMNGRYLTDEKGERIPISKFGMWSEELDDVVPIYSLSQEQADKVMEVINTTTRLYDENAALLDIISEQADAFYAGQKTAEEVAKLIQGKLNIYVNEQR